MNLTDEQKKIGKENFNRVAAATNDPTRRDVLKAIAGSGVAGAAGLGAMYYGYDKTIGKGDPLRVGVIGTGDEGSVLIGAINPEFVQVVAISDIRPYNVHRAFHGDRNSAGTFDARPGLIETQGKKYGYTTEDEAKQQVEVYENYEELLDDQQVEAVIIALPLFLHDIAAIKAMRAGKHVLTEKLMAHSVHQCKEMARVADQTGLLLATGHQRHYSVLYDNAVDTLRRGVIGDIHHIRAQWHRGNLPGNDSWTPPLPTQLMTQAEISAGERAAKKAGGDNGLAAFRNEHKLVRELAAWERKVADLIKKKAKPSEIDAWKAKVAQKKAQLADYSLVGNVTNYGYEASSKPNGEPLSPLEELIRWRLWNRTGGGLMAELGSHQLDASGIFISSQFEPGQDGKRTKVNPLSVTAVGGRHIFPADRDVDDHVYCTYEYPGKEYFKDNDPATGEVADANKKVVVTYSSINGNGYGGYGEIVMGTKGTLILEREKDVLLFAGSKTDTKVGVNKDDALTDSYETGGYESVVEKVVKEVSRGYTEEIEHWAWCIRNQKPAETLHCHPKVALADAVIALTSNIAMEKQQRIDFDPEWFDPKSDATPEGVAPRKAADIG